MLDEGVEERAGKDLAGSRGELGRCRGSGCRNRWIQLYLTVMKVEIVEAHRACALYHHPINKSAEPIWCMYI